MKKIQLLGLAIVAVLGVSAFASASAFAAFTTTQWLANANPVPAGGLETESTGGLTFENPGVGASFLCEGAFVGRVEPAGVDTVTEVLTGPKGAKVTPLDEAGATGGIKCVTVKLCEGTPEAWPVNLPFKTLLGLEGTELLDLFVNAEYFLLCQVLGVDATELCVVAPNSLSGGLVKNVTNDVEAEGSVEPLATCNGNVETGLVTADPLNLTVLTNGEPLQAEE